MSTDLSLPLVTDAAFDKQEQIIDGTADGHGGIDLEDSRYRLGLIGLGRMGAGIASRLSRHRHAIVGFDVSHENVARAVAAGATGVGSLQALVTALDAPRHVWPMVPSGEPTRETIEALLPLLSPNDVIVDGGNSRYLDSMAHAERCRTAGVHFLDVGVSGGVWGEADGFNLMIGGPRLAFERLQSVFAALAPPHGYAHVGQNGAGHFVKMIHNGIEYAMLQAIGEGFECLHRSPFELDLAQIATLWQHGAVVRSWLLELLTRAFRDEGNALDRIEDYVEDSGMGRWTVEYALDQQIPVPSIRTALYERFDSRMPERFAHQVIAALRSQFGGHRVKEATKA